MTDARFTIPRDAYTLPNPQSVFMFPTVRFTLLTPRLIRIESSPTGQFEDRPSQVFWYRCQPTPPLDISFSKQQLTLETESFQLTYRDSPAGLNSGALQMTVKPGSTTFHLDDPNPGQLPGTARTLDRTNGPIHLLPGLISRSGWVQLDDTNSLIFNPNGWLETRQTQAGYRDIYLLISGQDYKSALRDYQLVAGKPSLLPRAFLGNWWSRFWEYSQKTVRQLVERFEQEQIPLSVFILDMDWHITKTGNACSGWTGFSWNRSLFPDPPALMDWLHSHNLLTSLNLHPAEGIYPHEELYPQAARGMGLDPARQKPIRFDIAAERFARVYFNEILHPLEDMGIDFWWLDWQQGEQSRVQDLDPLWWLNHLHYFDLARSSKKRPVIFSRWGGSGNHRYPIGFSGDTIVSWDRLAYQPYFTAAAANAAYGWWSHDIGGHMRGMEDKELYTRWVQFGVLSPIFRLHCTKNTFIDRAPWAFDAETLRVTRKAMQFRHALVPYLYSMARRNELEGLPLITPLYYDYPKDESAYQASGQYLFGSELMAAPVVTPMDPDLNQSRQIIWFPPGEWVNVFNGEKISGPQWKITYSGLDDLPLFARAGAILPLQAETTLNGAANPQRIDLIVFPGKAGHFRLYEDDGITQEYLTNNGCSTDFNSSWNGSTISVRISPAAGDTSAIPHMRTYRILVRGVNQPTSTRAKINDVSLEVQTVYDLATRTAVIGPIETEINYQLTIEVSATDNTDSESDLKDTVMQFLKRARMESVTKWKISTLIDKLIRDISFLDNPDLKLSQSHKLGLIETITGAGAIEVNVPGEGPRIILVNPKQLTGFKCKGKKRIEVAPQGAILPKELGEVEIDYFGLIKQKSTSRV